MSSTLTIKISEKGSNPYNILELKGKSGCWIIAKTKPGEIEIIKLGWVWTTYLFVKRMFNRVKKIKRNDNIKQKNL